MTTKVELRPYQEHLVQAILADIKAGKKEVLLAACPGAGKTEIAMAVIDRLPGLRVLVLAHGTTVLRTNFYQRLKEQKPHLLQRVRVALPQEHRQLLKERFDLVLVDEAHEFYEVKGGMADRVIKGVKAKHVVLLTGSPSLFIGRKVNPLTPHAFSLQELHEEGKGKWSSDMMVELGTSSYDIKEDDWNQDGDVMARVKYGKDDTNKTLDDLLGTLAERLKLGGKSWNAFNKLVYKTVESGWNKVLTGLKKTIIACRSQAMADQVGSYFTSKGVKCLVSHSANDQASENIVTFKDDEKTVLLIVVDRAQLGFDFDRLMNFVDLTGSRNPNRIFQMLCRVVRTPKGEVLKKLFVKVMPATFSDVRLRFFMSGVLTLGQKEFFSTWDGRNFMRLEVPVAPTGGGTGPRPPREPKGGSTTDDVREPFLEPGMMVFGDYFAGLNHSHDKGYEPLAWVRLGETLGHSVHDVTRAQAQIVRWFREHDGVSPRSASTDPEERRLGALLSSYSRRPDVYGAFLEEIKREFGWIGGNLRTQASQQKVLDFFAKHNRWPKHVKSGEEKPVAQALSNNLKFPEFSEKVKALGYVSEKERRFEDLALTIAYNDLYGRWPSSISADTEERKLGIRLGNLLKWKEGKAVLTAAGYRHRPRTAKNSSKADRIREIKEFYRIHERLPHRETEPSLNNCLVAMCSPKSPRYEPEVSSWARSVGYAAAGPASSQETKESIKRDYEATGKLIGSGDPRYVRFKGYCRPSSGTYDPELAQWAIDRGFRNRTRKRS